MASKISTGLVGLAVEANPRQKLNILYNNILSVVSKIPATASYRKYTEEFANQQLKKLDTIKDDVQLEIDLGPGQFEEVIYNAKAELRLARKMISWKPWEGLAVQPPPGQWDWP
uniref:NADH dehydrogenase [ubiquinone] 1 alpha subcomplex subunit 5 n=1 Tax=Ciona intestinalis TaxID=7719 RepID=F6YWH4_CIOIN|nr:NADH dehydrogenase [ubiquinone] 1 alpha subcomplex subunit 5-like [Ciona intestinalis]|eukprot:XP_002128109.1 NADH dehydrogenase [ubiquinone] 1 alpha subcomplex subunit 5-like [Ciona intestinalis]